MSFLAGGGFSAFNAGEMLSGIGSKAGGPDYLLQLPRTITENQMRRGFAPEKGE